MDEIAIKIGLVVLGAVIAGIGYLLKRRIENKPILDEIEKSHKLLSIHKEMNEQKVSINDLRMLEESIAKKQSAAKSYSSQIKQEISDYLQEDEKEFITQAEMNEYSYKSYEQAKEKLKVVLRDLYKELDSVEQDALNKSQDVWEQYLEKQAEFAAIQYRGGSIQPVFYYGELERLTIERTASLKSELDEIMRLK